MKCLIDICTVVCRIKKNAQVSTYSIADLNIGHCVELTFFRSRNFFQVLEGSL